MVPKQDAVTCKIFVRYRSMEWIQHHTVACVIALLEGNANAVEMELRVEIRPCSFVKSSVVVEVVS